MQETSKCSIGACSMGLEKDPKPFFKGLIFYNHETSFGDISIDNCLTWMGDKWCHIVVLLSRIKLQEEDRKDAKV